MTAGPTARPGEVVLVAVLGANRVIGADGDQPFRIPADQRRFKAMTLGSAVVMGRRTYDAMGAPLPGRRNLVITRRTHWQPMGVETVPSLGEALRLTDPTAPVFVIGGGEIYAQALPLADRLELTEVDSSPDGDTFFPAFDRAEWVVSERDQREGYAFVTYERVRLASASRMRQPEAVTETSDPTVPDSGPSEIPDQAPSEIPDRAPSEVPDVPVPDDIPNPETGVGIGAGQPSTFEPEEETPNEPDDPDEPGPRS